MASAFEMAKQKVQQQSATTAPTSAFDTAKQKSKPIETPSQKDYEGIGSSVMNFGKSVGQSAYLGLGGQKNIDKISKQYMDNGDALFKLANKQVDKKKKEQLLLQAQKEYTDAEKVGGSIIGKTRSTKQTIADALGTLGWITLAGTPTGLGGKLLPATSGLGKAVGASKAVSTTAGRIAFGTGFGAGSGAQQALSKEKSGTDIAKSTVIGGATGLAVSGAVEGVLFGLRKLAQTKPVQKFIGNVYNRELQPDTKEMVKSLEFQGKTIGEKIANEVDDAGKPIYKGGYENMASQAKEQIKLNAGKIKGELLKVSPSTLDPKFQSPDFRTGLFKSQVLNFAEIERTAKRLPQKDYEKLINFMNQTKLAPNANTQELVNSLKTSLPLDLRGSSVIKSIESSGNLVNTLTGTEKGAIKAFDFKEPLLSKLNEEFGYLDDLQLKTIEAEIKKLPQNMSPLDLLEQRQIVDSKIAPNFWIDPSPQKSFVNNVRYQLRGIMKKAIEESAPNAPIKELNQKIAMAMDVKDLALVQEAIRRKGRGISSIGFWKPLAEILDRTIFNPQVTTRVSQGLKNLGQKTGGIPLRNITTRGVQEVIGGEQ